MIDPTKEFILFDEVKVQPFYVKHGFISPTVPFFCLAFRIFDFCYMSDVSEIPEDAKKFVRGSRLLFIDGLKPDPHISHFGFAQALAAVNELLKGPSKAYFTGLGHNMYTNLIDL